MERPLPNKLIWKKGPRPTRVDFVATSLDPLSGVETTWEKNIRPQSVSFIDNHPNGARRMLLPLRSGYQISTEDISWLVLPEGLLGGSSVHITDWKNGAEVNYVKGALRTISLESQDMNIEEMRKEDEHNPSGQHIKALFEAFQVRGLKIFAPEGFDDEAALMHIEDLKAENRLLKASQWGESLALFIDTGIKVSFGNVLESEVGETRMDNPVVDSFLDAMAVVVSNGLPDHLKFVKTDELEKILLSEMTFVKNMLHNGLNVHATTGDIYTAEFSKDPSQSVSMSVIPFGLGQPMLVHGGMEPGRDYPYAEERYHWQQTQTDLTIVRSSILYPDITRKITAPTRIDDQLYVDLASTPHPSGWESLLEKNIITIS